MHKISIQTTKIFEAFGIDDGFRIIHEAGFDGVDFTLIPFAPQSAIRSGESCVFSKTDDEIKEFFRPYKEAAEKYAVEFSQAHAPVQSLQKTPEACRYMIEVLKKSIIVCDYLNCPHLVVHPFFFGYDDQLDPKTEWDANISGYSQLIPAMKKHHVTVCLENMFGSYRGKIYAASCQTPAEANLYIDTLNEIAGEKCFAFCYDTGHSNLIGRDIYTIIRQLGHRIECLHIHDNDGWSDQHLAPYMGCADWNRFIGGMREIGYDGVLNFESHGVISTFDHEVIPAALKLTAETGKMFSHRILSGQ
ncbi:MAG: sugar phosphate isomerase/epimerase [Clostridia bacterium]|nr:sugar phosphate isomerase/epimerase [Clostridia bacterium]